MTKGDKVGFIILILFASFFIGLRLDELHEAKIYDLSVFDTQNDKYIENEQKTAEIERKQPQKVCLGQYTITHYCPCCEKCGTNGYTATGDVATPFLTVAVDPNEIPLGATIEINGVEYIAQDTGGGIKDKRIDICVSNHEVALQLGIYEADVYLITD